MRMQEKSCRGFQALASLRHAQRQGAGQIVLSAGFDPEGAPDEALRRDVQDRLRALAAAPADGLEAALAALATPDAHWRAAHPMNEMQGNAAALHAIWKPLKQAFPDLERRDLVFVAGRYEGRTQLAAMGHYCGTLRGDWLGIPASGKPMTLRYGEVWQVDQAGRVVQATLLWDVLDVLRQCGIWPLAPAKGVELTWQPPITGDGLRLTASAPNDSRASIEQTPAHAQDAGRIRPTPAPCRARR